VRFVLASFNPDKLRELEQLFDPAHVTLVSLSNFPGAAAPEETGETLEENARIKALAALAHTGLPAIADDTGLEVEALGGRPGVHSARFAGPRATYAENRARLLAALADVPPERRTARFRTVCLAVLAEGAERMGEGVLQGRITEQPRGERGFGYDSIFELPGLGRTLAELAPEEKNRLSHRARAARALGLMLASHPG
jgi:XTP/dITP diphosphohydrolase